MTIEKLGFIACAALLISGTQVGAEEIERMGFTTPTAQQSEAFAALPTDQVLDMMNFIRFKERAEYPEGSGFENKGWTGEQAYAEYGRQIGEIAQSVGGAKIVYMGEPQLAMIAPEGEYWDQVFVVRYESAEAFIKFISSDTYQKNSFHRAAAVADSRLYRLAPPDATVAPE